MWTIGTFDGHVYSLRGATVFLVNEGIGLILVIQTFYPSALNVLYNKDVYLSFRMASWLIMLWDPYK